MIRLVYLPEARFEVLEAVTCYHSCQDGLAVDFYRQFQKAEREVIEGRSFGSRLGTVTAAKILNAFLMRSFTICFPKVSLRS